MEILITICLLLLAAYLFDITSSKTKAPSIVMLLVLGFGIKLLADSLGIGFPNLQPVLPLLGTVGLILIVMEGALELELDRSKVRLIGASSLLALLPMLAMALSLAWAFAWYEDVSFKVAFVNAIPLCVISSAIAIPSARVLGRKDREFVTYESSLSDIFGVVLFNFVSLNETIGAATYGIFIVELLVMLVVSLAATIGLSFFISKSRHHVKFLPIILIVVLIYAVAKHFHLPALIFIFFFGLALHNIDLLKRFKFIEILDPETLKIEVRKFSEITAEFTFLVKALFFLLFGFLIEFKDIINLKTLPWAVFIFMVLLVLRAGFLKLLRQPIFPLIFLAPRGLITILLYLSIPLSLQIPLVNNALIVQLILLCAFFLMAGMMSIKQPATLKVKAVAGGLPEDSITTTEDIPK